ncbi:MAG: hypothetical protein CTY16_12035 [Methylobacter sp.]|nr:MAG: hypothetical protein CTY16_12035 [Methylobacter sp.]
MDAFNYTTKASRINRKRGWKIADLFPDCWRVSVEGGFLSVPSVPHTQNVKGGFINVISVISVIARAVRGLRRFSIRHGFGAIRHAICHKHHGGLTERYRGAILSALSPHVATGFSSSFRTGVQSPLKTVVFLCQKISASLKTPESFYYGVVILGELNGSPHLFAALLTLLNHATQCLAALGGGYSLLRTGLPA